MMHPYAALSKIAGYKLATLAMQTVLRNPARSRILMFHNITPRDAAPVDEYACTARELANTVDAYQSAGFRFISLDQLLALPPKEAERGYCVLTFDDGFSSVATLAAPLLAEKKIPFTVYMISGKVGLDGYLSGQALINLAENPLCTVGSHSITHPMFRFLSKDAARTELRKSKRDLEEIIGRPVNHFAFPYGGAYACSRRDVRLAAGAGYVSAVLTTPTVLSRAALAHPFSLPRLDRNAYPPAPREKKL